MTPTATWDRPPAASHRPDTLERFRSLLDVTLALNGGGDLDRLLDVILQTATTVADCEAASILIHDESDGALRFVAVTGPVSDGLVGLRVPLQGSLAGTIFRDDRVLYAAEVGGEQGHYREIDEATGFETRALLGVPMRIGDEVVGVLEVLNPARGRFDRADAEAVLVVAAQAAVAIRDARHKRALEQLNAKLAELAELKSDFLAITSHELRTPLTSVRGFGQILVEEVRDELAPYAQAVARAGQRMTDVVETLDVMAALRGEIGSHPGRRVSVRCLAEEVASMAEREVRMDFPDGLYVEGHGPRLRLLLGNLVKNAVQFSPDDRPVDVHAAVSGAEVHVRVVDHGRGIADEDLERIFEAYVQVQDPDRRDHEGLGVGLTVARAIAVQHGGALWAESDGPGRGATFHLILPLVR